LSSKSLNKFDTYIILKSLRVIIAATALVTVAAGGTEGQCYQNSPLEEISSSEMKSLQWMREEEMLAHDVYSVLAQQYEIPVFRNIAKSEMRHTTAVAGLLERYGIEDPAAEHTPGTFRNPELQSLYNELTRQGSSSFGEAIKVGLQIEDMDIADLERALEEAVDNEDIVLVYSNLLRGSKNHMKAFWFHAARNSIDWAPVHIPREAFDEITGSGNL
jgi:hypothetical protein